MPRYLLAIVIGASLLFSSSVMSAPLGASLFAAPQSATEDVVAPPGSLFAGRAKGGMFAKIERPQADLSTPGAKRPKSRYNFAFQPGVTGLRELIARAEAGRADYDAVQHGARIKTPKPPTQMTIAEINAWVDATPRQPHAIGRYQFIPKTFRRVARQAGISSNARFTPAVQDAMADVLFADAGIERFLAGKLSRKGFMHNLAKIWAGFPTSSGKSYYHGYAGNYATMTYADFTRAMDQIFPKGRLQLSASPLR